MTGYSREYSAGRSCRFLQPSSELVNRVVNGATLERLGRFVHTVQKPGVFGNFLLLNEKANGERFWNYLRMAFFECDPPPAT